ncbi:MAG: hypothetical protein RJA31_1157 [Actinomycetota bacterium]
MFESIEGLLAEHAQLQQDLADPSVHADAARAKKLHRRYAELNAIVNAHDQLVSTRDDLAAAKELAKDDPAFAEEIPALEASIPELEEKLRRLLIPRDPDDGRDVTLRR